MDEPTSSLDPSATKRIEELLSELVERVTIVIVTHNMQQAHRVSDRCAFLLGMKRSRTPHRDGPDERHLRLAER